MVRAWIGMALALVGCGEVDLPSGVIACGEEDACPRGMRCGPDLLCYAGEPPERPDAGGPVANVVFLTMTQVVPSQLGGLAGADDVCAEHAGAADLDGRFVAWLSSETVDVEERLAGARGWRRPDGLPFADTLADVAAGRIFYPARQSEGGAEVLGFARVVTATGASGERAGDTCDDFTTATGMVLAGDAGSTTGRFTDALEVACDEEVRLYCFGVDADVAVTPPAPPAGARRAFLSRPWIPGGGIASADARCAADAEAAELDGTFDALLSTTDEPAAARFDETGEPWVRVDGIPLAASAADLLAGELETALAQRADGSYAAATVWTGAPEEGGPSDPAVAADTCDDWASAAPGDGGSVSDAARAYASFFTWRASVACDGGGAPPSIYCLER